MLDAEVQRWTAMAYDELMSELRHLQASEVELDSSKYQVEVDLLENTDKYVQVMVAVDDGSLPASITPLTHTFICQTPLNVKSASSSYTSGRPIPSGLPSSAEERLRGRRLYQTIRYGRWHLLPARSQ